LNDFMTDPRYIFQCVYEIHSKICGHRYNDSSGGAIVGFEYLMEIHLVIGIRSFFIFIVLQTSFKKFVRHSRSVKPWQDIMNSMYSP
jgi:hypothetical protein